MHERAIHSRPAVAFHAYRSVTYSSPVATRDATNAVLPSAAGTALEAALEAGAGCGGDAAKARLPHTS
jgi:hypothetical protein